MITNSQYREVDANNIEIGTLVCFDHDWVRTFGRKDSTFLATLQTELNEPGRGVLVSLSSVGIVVGREFRNNSYGRDKYPYVEVLFGEIIVYVTQFVLLEIL